MSLSLQVYLATAGKFHAFYLASEYAKAGRLGGLYCVDHHIAPPKSVDRSLYHNNLDLKAWRLAGQRLGLGLGHTYAREARLFDRRLGLALGSISGGVFHGWNGHVGQTMANLDPDRWLRCVERSCPHNLVQHRLLLEEAERLDIEYHFETASLEAGICELETADVIIAPSRYSAQSYGDSPMRAKVRINPLGGNFAFRKKERHGGPLRILAIGNSFLRKGFHYLIQSLAENSDTELRLWIRGEVPVEYRKRISDSRVVIVPPLSRGRLIQLFEQATIFCLPSIDEGFGMVALEALAYGLPLVITDNVGAGDILNEAVALRVPIRNPRAIANAIESIANWSPQRYEQFDTERKRVLEANSWTNCAARMLAQIYRPLPSVT